MPAPLSVAGRAARPCGGHDRASCNRHRRRPGHRQERAARGAPGDGGVPRRAQYPGRASPRHGRPADRPCRPPGTARACVRHFRARLCRRKCRPAGRVGKCRRKCRPAGRVGKCRQSRPAFAGGERRPGRDLSTRCRHRRRERAPGPAGRTASSQRRRAPAFPGRRAVPTGEAALSCRFGRTPAAGPHGFDSPGPAQTAGECGST